MSENVKPTLISTEPAPVSKSEADIQSENKDLYDIISSSTKGTIAQAGIPVEFKQDTEKKISEENIEACPTTKSSPGNNPSDNGGNYCVEGHFDPPTSKRLVTNVSADSLHRALKKQTKNK